MRSAKSITITTTLFLFLIFAIFGGRFAMSYLSDLFVGGKDARIFELETKNERLIFELSMISGERTVIGNFDYIITPIYSRYPFNDRALIFAGAGSNDGVKKDFPVFTKEDFLLGRITGVYKNRSEIKTIFDPSWSSSVAIGESGTEAVIEGGRTPTLDLIPETAEIEVGDFVYNTHTDYPLNAPIGRIKEIFYERGDSWQKAEVEIPYEIDNIRQIKIYLDFP